MALSLGGGSLINALMGQAGNVGQQRQKQQDQLMQMMMKGFVPTDASQQGGQGKGLLSQLIGPTGVVPLQSPKPMNPGDFEMAPWNPAEVSAAERAARKAEADKRRTHDINMLGIQNENARALAKDKENWDIWIYNAQTERQSLSRELEHDFQVELRKAGDDDERKRIQQKYDNGLKLIEAEHEKDKLLEGIKLKNKGKYKAKDYMELVKSLTEINAAIKAADVYFKSAKEEKTYNALVKVRNEIMAIMDNQTQGGAAGVVGELNDALSGQANEATNSPTARQKTHQRGYGTR